MHLTAITMCRDYEDYLDVTIHHMREHCDRVLVVGDKGKELNAAIAQAIDWCLIIDADIVMMQRPPLKTLDLNTLWTVPRFNVYGKSEYISMVNGHSFPKEPAVQAHTELPIGYFQLWHMPTHPINRYKITSRITDVDVDFARKFNRYARIPGMHVFHLTMKGDKKSQNWKGRSTKVFT